MAYANAYVLHKRMHTPKQIIFWPRWWIWGEEWGNCFHFRLTVVVFRKSIAVLKILDPPLNQYLACLVVHCGGANANWPAEHFEGARHQYIGIEEGVSAACTCA